MRFPNVQRFQFPDEFTMVLRDIEKAVVQVLLQKHIIEETALLDLIERLKKDFEGVEAAVDLSAWFGRINMNIRKAGMAVKTVTVKKNVERDMDVENDEEEAAAPRSVWVKYHGIVNLEEDFVSKEYGTSFGENEVKLFSELIPQLLDKKVLSMFDVETCTKEVNLPASRKAEVMDDLEAEGWLQREGERGFWELGMRSYLELKTHMEAILVNGVPVEEGMDDDTIAKLQAEAKDALPTVLLY